MDVEQVRKVDEPSQEDGNLKSKMDGYKTIPQSGRVVPRGWKLKIRHGQTGAQVPKVDGESLDEENHKQIKKENGWINRHTHDHDGSSKILLIKWTDHPKRMKI